ncbi:MAG TPA: DUF4093 domain-containing protein [Candidatus Avoscillospira avicola]|uniref:DUF4093 domain-containing protein n=1 Tax=Candidatus Avoscillospira avicola TaxID=2840706 RepID=A0A9D1DHQ5_9FIRM|nr:DUF4093 domain-containing protein [Candidatus Avoscillospira avicola]
MVKIREAIVVEGKYDQNTLRQIVDTAVIPTRGFGVLKDRALLDFLRAVAEARGLIILTDSDGAGFVIRNYLKGALPRDRVRHAYIPDVPGKERRKKAPGKEGKLGVEGMEPAVLLEALRRAGATFVEEAAARPGGQPITKADLYDLGLSGGPGSREKRLALLKRLGLPAHMSANALLEALNLLYTREAFLQEFQP